MEKYCLSTTKQLFIAYRTFFNTGVSKILFSFLCQRKKTILKECMEMIFFLYVERNEFFFIKLLFNLFLGSEKKVYLLRQSVDAELCCEEMHFIIKDYWNTFNEIFRFVLFFVCFFRVRHIGVYGVYWSIFFILVVITR